MATVKEVTKNGRTWTVKDIRELLKTNDKALIKALIIIYNYQTEDEKASEITTHDNGMGFTGVDAPFLTSIVNSYNKYGSLTDNQLRVVRKTMLKYSGQILKHMALSE